MIVQQSLEHLSTNDNAGMRLAPALFLEFVCTTVKRQRLKNILANQSVVFVDSGAAM